MRIVADIVNKKAQKKVFSTIKKGIYIQIIQ